MPDIDKNYRSPWGEAAARPSSLRRVFEEPKKPKRSFKFVWIGLVFVLFAGIAVAYFYFSSGGTSVGIEFLKPGRVSVGEPFVLTVSFSNISDTVLKNAAISLFLPDGVSVLGQLHGQRVIEEAVGDIGPGSVNKKDYNLIVTAGGQEIKRISAKLRYSAGNNSGSQFESNSETDLLIGEPAVSLALAGPQSVFAGQDFEIKISYANSSGKEFKNLKLKMSYPPSFAFKRSTVDPEDAANNSWDLGDLAPGSNASISITGTVIGQEGSFSNFNASLWADFLGSSYNVNSQDLSMAISSSPLSLNLKLNGSDDYVAKLGDNLVYTINYRNNSGVVMQDVIIRAQLKGELFDIMNLSTDGVFDSLKNTISWFGANTPQLLNLAPGQSGSIEFKLKTKESFPIRLISDKNYTLKVQTQIESSTVPPGTTAEKTISLAGIENKVSGKIEIGSMAFWRDARSKILNQGPYPPRVNQPTQYTVHWIIKNYSTDVSNVAVSAFLQSGARFTGQVKSNIQSVPVFNPNSGLVTWNIDSIAATKGVISDPIEAVFQIEATPATTQVGQRLLLLDETKIEATDTFTSVHLGDSAPLIDSSLPYDTTLSTHEGLVQP